MNKLTEDVNLIKKRFNELSMRSENRGIYFYSDFLNLYEQTLLYDEIKRNVTLYGGFPEAERKIACFGNENEFGYEPNPPVKIICIKPLSKKFSDDLTHRDFLGSLIGLGIKRETLGDIIITENVGYVFCLDSISQYIIDNLFKVRHTSVSCEICDSIPENALPQPKEDVVIVSSLRLDVGISGIYNISRTKSSALVDGEKVFINGRLITSSSKNIELGDTVSVRGYGRFRYVDILGDTRKGRTRILCEIY